MALAAVATERYARPSDAELRRKLTPVQYAVTQLNKGLSNEEVCYACGYTDSSTFTRAFRKYYGVALQKYRKGFRKP